MAEKPPAKPADAKAGTSIAVRGMGTDVSEAGFSSSELEGLKSLGYSEDRDDSLVPILAIIQDNSGEVKKNHPKRIEGAEAGNLILRSLKKVIPVTNPIPVIPCAFTHYWVQWEGEPGEGKVIAQYPFEERPKEARDVPDPQDDKRMRVVMPDGTRLVDTRYWYCLVWLDGAWKELVIPMGGTNHTVSRSWNSVQMEKVLPVDGTPKAPSWFYVYGFETQFNSRGSQSWYTYKITELGWVTDPVLRKRGREVNEQVMAGELTIDLEAESGETVNKPDSSQI